MFETRVFWVIFQHCGSISPRNLRSAFHFAAQKVKVMLIKRYFLLCYTFASFLACRLYFAGLHQMMTKRWIGTKAWLVTADEFFFNLLWCLRCRWWTGSFVWRHPQFSFQAWSSFRPSLDLFGQARLGAVFLQGGPPRRDGANPQKSASLHHHESHRSQFGATDPCGKIFLYSFLQGQVKMIFQHHNSAFFSTLFKEEVILQSWPTARSFTFKNIFRSTTTKFSSFPHPSLCDFYLFHLGRKVFYQILKLVLIRIIFLKYWGFHFWLNIWNDAKLLPQAYDFACKSFADALSLFWARICLR